MRFLKSICAAVLVFSSIALAFGQMTPTGKLTGTVYDQKEFFMKSFSRRCVTNLFIFHRVPA